MRYVQSWRPSTCKESAHGKTLLAYVMMLLLRWQRKASRLQDKLTKMKRKEQRGKKGSAAFPLNLGGVLI